MKKQLYPGVEEAEAERLRSVYVKHEVPEFLGGKPNYEKYSHYKNWPVEKTLCWLNVD